MLTNWPTRRHLKPIAKFLVFLLVNALIVPFQPAAVSAAENYVLIQKWGTLGPGNYQFDFPEGTAVDSSGNVYVADSNNNRIQKFTGSGTFITGWGSFGSSDGQFNWPTAIAFDSSGTVYVADSDNNRIQKFTPDGVFVGKWGNYGSANGQFNFPAGIAVAPNGTVYVTDRNNHRVQMFTSSGTFIDAWGTEGAADGQFSYPDGLARDSAGNIYVADTNNDRIQKFTAAGAFTDKWGGTGAADGSFNDPEGIAVDLSGNVFVADRTNHRIQKFNSTGGFLTKWGSFGSADSQFKYPKGAAVDASGNVYVADTLNDRIQKFNDLVRVPPVTTLTTNPATPNGDNGWFKTVPTITLTRNETGTTFYQWDATASPATYAGPFAGQEGQPLLYYWSIDTDGNTETIKSQIFKVDPGLPVDPADIVSPSHTTDTPSSDRTIDIAFSGGTDTGSGVEGYAVSWSQNVTQTPPPVMNLPETVSATETTTSPARADGPWWFNLRTKDVAGNWTATRHLGPFVIDGSPPTTSLLTNPGAADGDNGWFKSALTVSLVRNEAGVTYYQWDSTSPGGWAPYLATLPVAEGVRTIYYYSVDTANNTEAVQSRLFKADTGAPIDPTETTSTSHQINIWSTNSTVTIKFAGATDTVFGVQGYSIYWSRDASQTPPATVNFPATGNATETTTSLRPDGVWWFNLRTKDYAGNWTSTVHVGPFRIEARAPTTGLTANPPAPDGDNGWYKTNPLITLSPDESATTFYAWNADATTTYTAAVRPPSQGVNTLRFFSVDEASNVEATKSQEFKVDSGQPVDPAVSTPSHAVGAWSGDQTIDISISGAIDSASGVDGFSFDWDPDPNHVPDQTKDAEEGLASTASGPLSAGTWYFHLRTKDNAGNWTSTVHYGPFKIDTNKPSAFVRAPKFSTNVSKTRAFRVKWSGSDALSGVASHDVQRRVGPKGTWADWKSGTASTSALFKGRPGKTYYFRARATDAAGNLSAWSKVKRTIMPFDNNSLIASRVGFTGLFKKASTGFYLGTTRYSNNPGDKITYKFRGKSVALIGPRAKNRSKAKIYINGRYIKTINAYAKRLRHRKVLYSKTWKKGGRRTITIENVGNRKRFDVDGLAVGR